MKKVFATAAALLSASTAFAGSIAFEAPQSVTIDENVSMGGSGAWIIPLVIVAVLALALSQKVPE